MEHQDITDLDLSQFLESEERVERDKILVEKCKEFMASCGSKTLEVYRMEKFTPTLQKEETHGKFYEGDSYVVLKKDEKKQRYYIHYWKGKECTSDEAGSSAIFSVQLAARLTWKSQHVQEFQENESDEFMSYFSHVEYLEGGVETAFKDVTKKKFVPRLLQCKGERHPRVFKVDMKPESINLGDVYILDMNDKLYFWEGPDCNVTERMKGLEVVTNMRKAERHAQATILFPKDDEEADAAFWKELGGKPATIQPATSDDAEKQAAELQYEFYKVSNADGTLQCTAIKERPLTRAHLDTNDVFILELHNHVFIWIGKEANVEEKKRSLYIGKGFLEAKKKPANTRVTRVVENTEDALFKSFFNGFYPILEADHGVAMGYDAEVKKQQDMEKVANAKRANYDKLIDKIGKSWTTKVYLCYEDKEEPTEIPESDYGHFFQDEVYLVDIQGESGLRYLIQWFGPRLSADLISDYRKHMAFLTGGEYRPRDILRVTVRQGHEDDSLLKFFPNGFICHDGPYQPIEQRREQIKEKGCLFRIAGPFGEQPQAVEQDQIIAEKLNSNDAFFTVAKGGDAAYYWLGEGATDAEKAYAKSLAAILAPSAATQSGFDESKETDEFWNCLGGKKEYSSLKQLGVCPGFDPRLFAVSNAQGWMWMTEIPNFVQYDLNNYDVMVLDGYSTIFIWFGIHSNKFEKKGALKKVEGYIAALSDGRDKDSIQIVEVEPCSEPFNFTQHFPEWEDEVAEQWLQPDPVTALKLKIQEDRKKYAEENKEEERKFLDPATNKMPLSDLKGKFPPGVKPDAKETYLSTEDFNATFGMDYASFSQLKLWKQQQLKKNVGLF